MRRTQTILAAWALLLPSLSAHAGHVVGRVSYVTQRASDGLIYVFVDGPITGAPSCATVGYFMIADENSEAGKKQFATLLLAKASGLTVAITGTNSCTRWGDGENINELKLMD